MHESKVVHEKIYRRLIINAHTRIYIKTMMTMTTTIERI